MDFSSSFVLTAGHSDGYVGCGGIRMTPEREKYLAKCSEKERRLRDLIQSGKSAVKRLKRFLSTSTDYPRVTQLIFYAQSKRNFQLCATNWQGLKVWTG